MGLFTKRQEEMIDEVILGVTLSNPRLFINYWEKLQKEIPKWQIIPRFLAWLTERRFTWKIRGVVLKLYPKIGFEEELRELCPPFCQERLINPEGLTEVFSQERERLTREIKRLVWEIQKAEQAQREIKLEILQIVRKIREYDEVASRQKKAVKELQSAERDLSALGEIRIAREEKPISLTLAEEPEKLLEGQERAPS